jgi:hypothetical protein
MLSRLQDKDEPVSSNPDHYQSVCNSSSYPTRKVVRQYKSSFLTSIPNHSAHGILAVLTDVSHLTATDNFFLFRGLPPKSLVEVPASEGPWGFNLARVVDGVT